MRKIVGIVLLYATLSAGANASLITWTTNAVTGNPSDVVNIGTTVEAINGAHTSRTETPTINGVTFTSSGDLLGGNWNGDPWTPAAADADYDTLLSTIDFESSGTDPYSIITFTGLTEDAPYLIQYWYADSNWQAPDPDRTLTFNGDGQNTIDGLSYAVGTFTADATETQELTVAASHNGPRMTAVQLRLIPEPGTLGLMAIGGVAMLGMRRRSADKR